MNPTSSDARDTRAIQDLITRVDAQLPVGQGRLVGFIASGAGEGTSTVAAAYARLAAEQLRRRVLLLEAGQGDGSRPGLLATLADGRAIDEALEPLPGGGWRASLCGTLGEGSIWELSARTEFWRALRDRFDEVVVDLPAPDRSRLGLAVAPHCDGVAVVVEAEKTRAPVAEHLVSSLRAVRARVLGAVLNRRRFHLPVRIYRML